MMNEPVLGGMAQTTLDRPDPLLRESAAILADAIEVLGQDKKLSAVVLPESSVPGRWAD